MRKRILAAVLAMALAFSMLPAVDVKAATTGQYTNPLMNGADPTIVRGEDGYFYSGFGTDNDIYIKRSETLLGLSTAESHLVWDNPNTGNKDGNKNFYIWGPYIYHLEGAWYIYYSSSTENDFGYGHPSCYVLENTAADPFEGEWHLKGTNSNIDDFDGNASEKAGLMNTESYGLACGVVTIAGEPYFTYTKYDYFANEPGHTKFNECPTIVKMKNPWTLTGPECTVARPTYAWELHGDNVNEGCAYVEHGGKGYFAYSASSFTNDNYCVGLSVVDLSTDVMDEKNWKKSTTPILSRSDENSSFGPGSPLFVKSPDQTEDWLIYHGGPIGGQTATDRRVRAQIVNWTDDGFINLGIPSNPDTVLGMPSGEMKTDVYEAEYARFENVSKIRFNNTAKASGSGYLKFDQGNGYVEFDVDAKSAGSYSLGFRYNNLQSTVNARLSVNGQDVQTVAFKKNGTYTVDLNEVKAYNVQLSEGINKIRVSVDEASEFSLDTMIVTKAIKYDAVDAKLLNGAAVENDYVGKMYETDATVEFDVEVPYTGYYAVNLAYADGFKPSDGEKYATVYVNGTKVKLAPFSPTGGWQIFGNRIDNLYLQAGSNTIAYANHEKDGRDTGDVNYKFITVTECATNTYSSIVDDNQLSFKVNVESEGIYDVTFIAEDFDAANVELTVNGEKKVNVAYNQAKAGEATCAIKLVAGENTISLTGLNDYQVDVKELHVLSRTPWHYQAENAAIKGSTVCTDHLYYNGTGFVGGFENDGDSVEFTTNVAYSGTHTLTLRHCTVGDNKTLSLYVNGKKLQPIEIFSTQDWDTWGETSFELYLNAGKNRIEFRKDAEDSGRLNIDEIVIDKFSLGAPTTSVASLTPGEVYVIRDKNSFLSLDVKGYSDKAGVVIQLYNFEGHNNQKWKLVETESGYWGFKSTFGSKFISVDDNKNIITADYDANDASQQWALEKEGHYYRLRNIKYDQILTVVDGSKTIGAKLTVADDINADYQLFSIDGGIYESNTNVEEILTPKDPEDCPSFGNQYELVDPKLPQPVDSYKTSEDGRSHIYDAANALLLNGAKIETNHNDYLGENGFVGGMFAGDATITFSIKTDIDGVYKAKIRYCNGFGSDQTKKALVKVNDVALEGALDLPSTGDWDSWGESELTLVLEKGVNKISFINNAELAGAKGDVNYDILEIGRFPVNSTAEVSPSSEVFEGEALRFELENALLSSGAVLAVDHLDFNGDGFVGGMYNGSATIDVTVDVAETRDYDFVVRYANGHGADVEDKFAAVMVNGEYKGAIEFPKTGSWDDWSIAQMTLNLNAGRNTISFVNSAALTGHAGDVNYDFMDMVTGQLPEDAYTSKPPVGDEETGDDEDTDEGEDTGDGEDTEDSGNTPGGFTPAPAPQPDQPVEQTPQQPAEQTPAPIVVAQPIGAPVTPQRVIRVADNTPVPSSRTDEKTDEINTDSEDEEPEQTEELTIEANENTNIAEEPVVAAAENSASKAGAFGGIAAGVVLIFASAFVFYRRKIKKDHHYEN